MPDDMRFTLKKASGAEVECSVLMSFERDGMLYILYCDGSDDADMPANVRMIKIDIDDYIYARPIAAHQTDEADWQYLAEAIGRAMSDMDSIGSAVDEYFAGDTGLLN